jgi:ABC-type transporter MlaC component
LSLPDAEETWIWRLRPSGQSWRIVDVAIDGSSVLSTERQEYAEFRRQSRRYQRGDRLIRKHWIVDRE